MTKFSQFLCGYDSLMEEVAQLIDEADTIEFDPTVGAEFKGKGFTSNVSAPQRPATPAVRPQTQTSLRAKQGDVVFMPGPGGQLIPTVVSMTDQNNAMLTNQAKNIKAIRPLNSLTPAPAQMMARFPGRNGWTLRASGAEDTLR